MTTKRKKLKLVMRDWTGRVRFVPPGRYDVTCVPLEVTEARIDNQILVVDGALNSALRKRTVRHNNFVET